MRAKSLVLAGVFVLAGVVALRWTMAKKGADPEEPEQALPTETAPPPSTPIAPPTEPSPPPPTAAASPSPAGAAKMADEGELLAEMRAALTADPAQALRLARDAERRFGETRHAAERGRVAIEALVRLNDIAEARNQAEPFIRKHRGTDQARYVESLTGVHPRPSGPREARTGPSGGSSR